MPATHSRPELVKETWDILVQEAAQGRCLTYGELAARLSRPGYRLIPQSTVALLTPMMTYCDDHQLPRLNDLVVGQRSQPIALQPAGAVDEQRRADLDGDAPVFLERLHGHD